MYGVYQGLQPGLPPVRYSTGQFGFGVCCPGGRRDLKPDYKMSGFGSNDYILIIKLINQCGLVVPIADAMLSRVLINIESSKSLYIFNARTSTQNFKVENFNFQFRDFVRKNNENNEGLQNQTLNISSK